MARAGWRAGLAGIAAIMALSCPGCIAIPAAPVIMAHASVLAPLILHHAGLIVASDAAQTAAGLPSLANSATVAQAQTGPGYDW